MKKFCIIFIFLFIIILTATVFYGKGETSLPDDYFRIHIRANSNDEADQKVKYRVRDGIVKLLTPLFADAKSKKEAMQLTSANLSLIEQTGKGILRANGFSYSVRAEVRKEQFPLRIYEEATLPQGEYDALIIELGEGKGDNWWCLIYPPMCFIEGGDVTYRSKLWEMWKERLHKEEN